VTGKKLETIVWYTFYTNAASPI